MVVWLARDRESVVALGGAMRLNAEQGVTSWHGRCWTSRERQGAMVGRAVRRVVAPTLVSAVLTSMVAVVVNLATEWKSNPWAWLAVGVTTVLVAVAALWLEHRRGGLPAESERSAHRQVVKNSTIYGSNFQVGGDVSINRDRER